MAFPNVSSTSEELPQDPTNHWELFYANYRKPGYVPGYEIVHKLGGGVFGIVFKARKESIGKAYAIKFLKIDDPSVKEQVLRELETVSLFAQVDHPNLVSIEDKGVVDGIPFIVMGFAGEETLKSRLDEGPLATEDAFRLFIQVLRGVQALHEHSLIHFDLKPANIFIKGDIARVGDYGLSKLVSESRRSLSMGRGTPYYMAPEMLNRKGDHRSDIYSLGIMFYECLCGEPPFVGENEWEVLEGHKTKEVEFPATMPREYKPVIAQMLAKDPELRYQSLEEVLRDLRAPVALGESILIEYSSEQGSGGAFATKPGGRRAQSAEKARAFVGGAPAMDESEDLPRAQSLAPIGPANVAGSIIRAMVIALLLPARVLGLGMGRGLQLLVSVPFAILGFLGKVSLVLLGVAAVLLVIFIISALFFGV
jgi:serine/threonine protein kinase